VGKCAVGATTSDTVKTEGRQPRASKDGDRVLRNAWCRRPMQELMQLRALEMRLIGSSV
jgi:hypothetical protein